MTDPSPLRIVIADDHVPTRRVLRAALEDAGVQVCGEAATAAAAVHLTASTQPDAVVLDIDMPGGGIDAAARITADSAAVVVMRTVSHSDEDLLASLQAGAAGYVLKDAAPSAVLGAIHAALAGETIVPRGMLTRAIGELRARSPRRLTLDDRNDVLLTERESEVLALLGQGLTTAEIARRMFVSSVTVRTHVSAITRKLGVSTRAEAVDRFKSVEGSQRSPESATKDVPALSEN